MDRAEILEESRWVEISIEEFAQWMKGIFWDKYPLLSCISCEESVHDIRLVTPNPNY